MKGVKRYRAEVWDKVQLCYKEYNDHQLHCVIYINGILDVEYIKQAVLLSIELIPLLGSRFVKGKFRAYWEKVTSFSENDVFTYKESMKPNEEINQFLISKTNELSGPQFMVKLIRNSNKDALCVIINHMVCDGASFKEFIYLLSSLYTKLKDGTYNPYDYKIGSRSSKKIYSNFNLFERMKILLLTNENSKNENKYCFPIGKGQLMREPFILKYKLSQERFCKLKEYSKKNSVTINDIVVTAYFRALYKILNLGQSESLTIPSMVDLRRYIPDKETIGICNHSSMIMFSINMEPEESFVTTLQKVNKEMLKKKENYPGLNGLIVLNTLFKILPFSMAVKQFKKHFVNPLICITNIGIIDSNKLVFDNTPLEDAFITSSIKQPPYFQLAFSSFNSSITFCVNLFGTENDKEAIQSFYAILDDELISFSK